METIEKAIETLSRTNTVRIREIETLCQIAQESSSELMQLECITRILENAVVLSKNAVYIYAEAYSAQKEGEISNVSKLLNAMLGLRNDTETLNDILNEYVELD
jgi:hypothetical protein